MNSIYLVEIKFDVNRKWIRLKMYVIKWNSDSKAHGIIFMGPTFQCVCIMISWKFSLLEGVLVFPSLWVYLYIKYIYMYIFIYLLYVGLCWDNSRQLALFSIITKWIYYHLLDITLFWDFIPEWLVMNFTEWLGRPFNFS